MNKEKKADEIVNKIIQRDSNKEDISDEKREQQKFKEVEQEEQEQLEKLEKENRFYKCLLFVFICIIFNIGVFKSVSSAGAIVIGIFELLSLILYSKSTQDPIIAEIWKEILGIFNKKDSQ